MEFKIDSTSVMASEAKRASEVSLIHAASAFWICKVAHKIRTNRFSVGDCGIKMAQEVEVPVQEKWELELGDEVRIKYKLPEFKAIQKKTIGWHKKWRQAVSQYGFISNTCNEYDPHVIVSFPEIDMECEIYAGVLEKIPSSHGENGNLHFRPGDVVSIHSSKKIADLLQRGYDNLPDSFLTKKGQVIAVTCDQVFVTFEGTICLKMNPALLKLESGSEKPVFKQSSKEAGKFKVGDKVKVIPNLKKVIEQQEGHGGWTEKMIEIIKGNVTVLLLKEDDILRVRDQRGLSWHFNAKSLLLKDETPEEDQDEDVPYKIGDQVRVKNLPNIRQILEEKGIPLTILQFLQLPAEVSTYTAHLEAGITYDATTNIVVNSLLLEKVSDASTSNIQDTKKALKNLKQGDKVHLNVGPPSYVRDVLKETSASDKVITALTTSAVIHGFKGPNHVIIKYSDGERYKIHKKYITLPSTYHIRFQDKESKFKWENVPEVTSVLKNCLDAIHDDFQGSEALQLDHGLDSISLVQGQPAILDVKITSPIATYENLLNTLRQMSGWKIEKFGEGMIDVKELPGCRSEVKMKFSINEDEKQVMKYVKSESIEEPTRKIVGGLEDEQQLEAEREPPGYQPPGYAAPQEPRNLRSNLAQEDNPRAGRQRNLPEGDLGTGIPTSHKGFKLMQLSDETLGRTVLFPYLLVGEHRAQSTAISNNKYNIQGSIVEIFQTPYP